MKVFWKCLLVALSFGAYQYWIIDVFKLNLFWRMLSIGIIFAIINFLVDKYVKEDDQE